MYKTKKLKDNKCVLIKYDGNENIITIPEKIDGMVVSKINKEAFANTDVEFVIVPGSIKTIEDNAFANCANLNSVVILEGVEKLGANIFDKCLNLKYIKMPVSIKKFKDWGELDDKNLVVHTNNVAVISYCFDIRCGICKIKSDIPVSMIRIEKEYFEEDVGSSFYIENIDDKTCYIKEYFGVDSEVYVPGYINGFTVVKIGKEAFKNTLVENVVLADTIKEIDDGAFADCENLNKVFMHDSVEKIGNYAFSKCINLEQIVLSKNVKTIGNFAFTMCRRLNKIELPEGLIKLGSAAFQSCSSLDCIVLPDSLDKVEKYTFKNCNELVMCRLSNNISVIEDSAFEHCKRLTDIIMSQNVSYIGNKVFANCISLPRLYIPENVKVLGSNVFDSCIRMGYIKIKGNPLSIELDTFAGLRRTEIQTSSPLVICSCLHSGVKVNIEQIAQ